MRSVLGFVVIAGLLILGAGCADPEEESASCIPGETQQCYCTDGSAGAQECEEDRTFGTCVCDSNGSSGDAGGDVGGDAGECTPDCSGLECGEDPVCGESCGECEGSEVCDSGQCVCTPDCSGLECGEDPVCGESCGECDGINVCDSGQCVEADSHATWKLDGEVVHSATSATVTEPSYNVSQDTASTSVGSYVYEDNQLSITRVMVWIYDVSERDEISIDCDSPGSTSDLSTTMPVGASGDMPIEWHGEQFSRNNCTNSVDEGEDEAVKWDFEFTEITSETLVGDFSIEILGAGPREGSTLEVFGQFDDELEEE